MPTQVKSSRVHIIPTRIFIFLYLRNSLLKDWPPITFRTLEQNRTDRPKATLQYCPGTGSSQMLQSNQNSKYAKFNWISVSYWPFLSCFLANGMEHVRYITLKYVHSSKSTFIWSRICACENAPSYCRTEFYRLICTWCDLYIILITCPHKSSQVKSSPYNTCTYFSICIPA